MKILIEHQSNRTDQEILLEGLEEFNFPFLGPAKEISFLVCLKDEANQTVGGVSAWMLPKIGLLTISIVWVSKEYRGQGYGKKLLLTAEEEGKKRGATHAQLETLPFQAEEFYKKFGYVRIGCLEKFYGEYDAFYLRKIL